MSDAPVLKTFKADDLYNRFVNMVTKEFGDPIDPTNFAEGAPKVLNPHLNVHVESLKPSFKDMHSWASADEIVQEIFKDHSAHLSSVKNGEGFKGHFDTVYERRHVVTTPEEFEKIFLDNLREGKVKNFARYHGEILAGQVNLKNAFPQGAKLAALEIANVAKGIQCFDYTSDADLVGRIQDGVRQLHGKAVASLTTAHIPANTPTTPTGTTTGGTPGTATPSGADPITKVEEIEARVKRLAEEKGGYARSHQDLLAKYAKEAVEKSVNGNLKNVENLAEGLNDTKINEILDAFKTEATKEGGDAAKNLEEAHINAAKKFLKNGVDVHEDVKKAAKSMAEGWFSNPTGTIGRFVKGANYTSPIKAFKSVEGVGKGLKFAGTLTSVGLIYSGFKDFKGREEEVANDNSGATQTVSHPISGLIKTAAGLGVGALSLFYRGIGGVAKTA